MYAATLNILDYFTIIKSISLIYMKNEKEANQGTNQTTNEITCGGHYSQQWHRQRGDSMGQDPPKPCFHYEIELDQILKTLTLLAPNMIKFQFLADWFRR
jgi:hypothetical protein